MVFTMVKSRRATCRCRLNRSSGLLALFVVGGAPIHAAMAQEDSSAADTAAARTLAVEGLRLADAGRCAEAIEKLSRAEKLHHGPIVLGRLGECQIGQGKVVDGTENLRKVLREPLPPNPSPALVKARDRAQAALDAAKPKIAFLIISVKPVRDNMIVNVDGQPMSTVLLEGERPTDPGEHTVEATAPGFLKASTRLSLAPGEKHNVNLKLEPDPNAAATAPPESSTSPRSSASSESPSSPRDAGWSAGATASTGAPNRTLAYVSWAVGGAALAVGAGFGYVAIKDKKDLDNACRENVCPPNQQSKLDSATTAGDISTVAFAAGGVGIVLGTILYFTAGSRSASRASAEAPGTSSGFRPRAWIGVGSAGFGADF